MPRLLDLPPDITALIFRHFARDVDQNIGRVQEPWHGLVTLQACRLTCRVLNELLSSLLCPVFRGSLDRVSMERIDRLSRNPSIAEGMRAVEINLAFRCKSIASSLSLYCDFVTDKVDRLRGSCHYDTEFQHYEDEDQSSEAIKHRTLLEVEDRLYVIRESWRQCVESGAHRTADVSAQQLLRDCFATYARQQREEEEIITDGSFLKTFATAMVRFKHPAYLTFVDEVEKYPRSNAETVANDRAVLAQEMLKPHDWLSIETKNEEGRLRPARLLVELPISCARLGAPLQSLDIGCFPLTTHFTSLIPLSKTDNTKSDWSELSRACEELKTFNMGRRGMHSTPHRLKRIPSKDCELVDGYLGAACSSPKLTSVYISMCPFRVSPGSGVSPDLFYRAGGFLRRLSSSCLTHVEILYVEVSGSDLVSIVSTLPRFRMKKIRLCDITLNDGGFTDTIETLRAIKQDSMSCNIDLSTLGGGEFGAPRGFDDSDFLWSDEDGDAFLAWLEEHRHPPLLRSAIAYVLGENQVNPLLTRRASG